jgi:hypothetical protein
LDVKEENMRKSEKNGETINLLREDVPLPLDRTKHIIRKCTDDDFDPPEE